MQLRVYTNKRAITGMTKSPGKNRPNGVKLHNTLTAVTAANIR